MTLYAERLALTRDLAHAERPTGKDAQAVLDKGAELDAACEVFRRRFYPRSGRAVVGLYAVMVSSPGGRRTRLVYDGRLSDFTDNPTNRA
ncbi:MAG TPA: hypothetical protein VF049_04430 [Nocardioidaceae bacterium]